MSQIAGAAQPRVPDAQAVATARQALDRAQGRVDADKRAHSPGCVAVDQKTVDKASAELAHAQAADNAAARTPAGASALPAGRVLSVTA